MALVFGHIIKATNRTVFTGCDNYNPSVVLKRTGDKKQKNTAKKEEPETPSTPPVTAANSAEEDDSTVDRSSTTEEGNGVVEELNDKLEQLQTAESDSDTGRN